MAKNEMDKAGRKRRTVKAALTRSGNTLRKKLKECRPVDSPTSDMRWIPGTLRDAISLLRTSLQGRPLELIKGIGTDYDAAWSYLFAMEKMLGSAI